MKYPFYYMYSSYSTFFILFCYPHSESFHLLSEIFLLLYTRIHLLYEKIRLFLFFFRLIFADFTIDFEKNKLFKIREDSSITALSCFIFINICFFNLLYIIIYIKTQGTSYGYLDIDILLSRLYPCNI